MPTNLTPTPACQAHGLHAVGNDRPARPLRAPFSFSMLGWAFNEEESVAAYIDRAQAFLERLTDDYELVLIDDGSTDRTRPIIEQCQRTRPWLRLSCNDRNRGSGYNTKRAIALATKDYLFWQTVDWAYDIEALLDCWPLLREYDVLQGVRDGTLSLAGMLRRRSDTAYKGFVSVVNYWLIRLLYGLPVRDYQNVTVYPRRLAQSLVLESESAFTNPECLLKAWWSGATIHEFPVPFRKRERGQGKGTRLRTILKSIADIVYWRLAWSCRGRVDVSRWHQFEHTGAKREA